MPGLGKRSLRGTSNRAVDVPYRLGNVAGNTDGRSIYPDG